MSAFRPRLGHVPARSLDRLASLPALLAFMPAVTLSAFWLGGEVALLTLALGLPLGMVLARATGALRDPENAPRDSTTGLLTHSGFADIVREKHAETADGHLKSACLLLEIDEADVLLARHGQAALDRLMQCTSDRVIGALRVSDTVARLGDYRLAVCLDPGLRMDLELCIQLASRLQAAVEEPVQIGGATLFISCSVGFCLRNRAPAGDADTWLNAAITALDEARQNGPSALRAFTPDMQARKELRKTLNHDVIRALENGDIHPWFQPQLSTDTGQVSGFEALARWSHPDRGVIPPGDFIPALEAQGQMEALGDVILHQSLKALVAWENHGFLVPHVSINLSQQDLANPRLREKIAWQLDRFDLEPDRLCVEILETVVATSPDDTVVRTIAGLKELGCLIDLDDYGTGHASIAALRQFPVDRIKIDRSFVMKSDKDADQQRMIGALLTMAERLEVATLAEGVETAGEHAYLAQLGCDHVQGFAIGRPMPFDDTLHWLHAQQAKFSQTPRIGRQMG